MPVDNCFLDRHCGRAGQGSSDVAKGSQHVLQLIPAHRMHMQSSRLHEDMPFTALDVHTHAHSHLRTCTYARTSTCTHINAHTLSRSRHLCARARACTCTCTRTYTRVCAVSLDTGSRLKEHLAHAALGDRDAMLHQIEAHKTARQVRLQPLCLLGLHCACAWSTRQRCAHMAPN